MRYIVRVLQPKRLAIFWLLAALVGPPALASGPGKLYPPRQRLDDAARIALSEADVSLFTQPVAYGSPRMAVGSVSMRLRPAYNPTLGIEHRLGGGDPKTGDPCVTGERGKPQRRGFFAWLFGRRDATQRTKCTPPGDNRYTKTHRNTLYPGYYADCRTRSNNRYTKTRVTWIEPGRYRLGCDPNLRSRTTTAERLGKRIKWFFTNKRKQCAIMPLFTSVSAGEMIETARYGNAIVVDFKIRNRVEEFIEYPDDMALKGQKRKRKWRAIYRITLKVTENDPDFPLTRKGYYLVCLSPEETKEVMIRYLIEKGMIDDLPRMYPEERANIAAWQEVYGEEGTALNYESIK